jgi:hypothetical protein
VDGHDRDRLSRRLESMRLEALASVDGEALAAEAESLLEILRAGAE